MTGILMLEIAGGIILAVFALKLLTTPMLLMFCASRDNEAADEAERISKEEMLALQGPKPPTLAGKIFKYTGITVGTAYALWIVVTLIICMR